MAERLHRREEAQAQIVLRHGLEEVVIHVLVFRPHRPHEHFGPILDANLLFLVLGIGRDRKAPVRLAGALPRIGLDADARVHHHHAVLVGEQRIEIELAHFRNVCGELRQFHQRQGDGVDVGARHVAIEFQNISDTRALDHVVRQREIERRQRQRPVVDDLHRLAAAPEHDHRPEGRIVGYARDQFAAVRAADHWMHGHAFDPRLRHLARDPRHHLARRLHRCLGRADVEHDAADVGLVRDVARHDLDDAGARPRNVEPRQFAGFLGRAGKARRRDGNVVGVEQPRHLDGREPAMPALDGLRDDAARALDIRLEILRQVRRRAHHELARFVPAHHVHETAHRARLVMRNARVLEQLVGLVGGPEPHREDGLGRERLLARLLHRVDHRFGGFERARQGARRVHHHHGVGRLVVQQRADDGLEA